MCMIIHTPAGVRPSDDLVRRLYRTNSDGIGVFYIEGDEVKVGKALPKSEDEAVTFIRQYDHILDRPIGIHFRYRTSGNVSLDNVHPFQLLNKAEHGRDLWVMHNGVIPITIRDQLYSDTWHFAEALSLILAHLPKDINPFEDGRVNALIKLSIGTHSNKLLVLDSKTKMFYRFNESLGTVQDGCWFSSSVSQYRDPIPVHSYRSGTYQPTVWTGNQFPYGNNIIKPQPTTTTHIKPRIRIKVPTAEIPDHPAKHLAPVLSKSHARNPATTIPIKGKLISLSDFVNQSEDHLRTVFRASTQACLSLLPNFVLKRPA